MPPQNWTKATETELRVIKRWKGQGRKGREGTGIKEGEGGDGRQLRGNLAREWKREGREGREGTGIKEGEGEDGGSGKGGKRSEERGGKRRE